MKTFTAKLCTYGDCMKKHYAKGLCHAHYERQRIGKPMDPPLKRRATSRQDMIIVLDAVKNRDRSECWTNWVGYHNKGYPVFGSNTPLSHVVLEADDRPRNGNLHALHTCPGGDNPACWNPDHLRWGTPEDNARDAVERGRQDYARIGRLGAATRWHG